MGFLTAKILFTKIWQNLAEAGKTEVLEVREVAFGASQFVHSDHTAYIKERSVEEDLRIHWE